jgi:hypothetical protein
MSLHTTIRDYHTSVVFTYQTNHATLTSKVNAMFKVQFFVLHDGSRWLTDG